MLNDNLVVVNATEVSTTFTISSLTPGTCVFNISVVAYTRAGAGEVTTIQNVSTYIRPREWARWGST